MGFFICLLLFLVLWKCRKVCMTNRSKQHESGGYWRNNVLGKNIYINKQSIFKNKKITEWFFSLCAFVCLYLWISASRGRRRTFTLLLCVFFYKFLRSMKLVTLIPLHACCRYTRFLHPHTNTRAHAYNRYIHTQTHAHTHTTHAHTHTSAQQHMTF